VDSLFYTRKTSTLDSVGLHTKGYSDTHPPVPASLNLESKSGLLLELPALILLNAARIRPFVNPANCAATGGPTARGARLALSVECCELALS
jgi:hypothetical protein